MFELNFFNKISFVMNLLYHKIKTDERGALKKIKNMILLI
jgi:hypothetical protein